MLNSIKKYCCFLIFLGMIVSVFCYDSKDETSPKTYAIGDIGPSGVGKVFYITSGGLHGLEAAPSDQQSQVWISGGATQTSLIGNTSTTIGAGYTNTLAIILQPGHLSSAAEICRSYAGGGKNDWYLPSKDELDQMYIHRDYIKEFYGQGYWSSTENDASQAWFQNFINGNQQFTVKYSLGSVRAIRAF